MPCDDRNFQGPHFHSDCPLPVFCTGCHSEEHCWSDCRAKCDACGTTHTGLDFKPGQAQKPHDFAKRPKQWPHMKPNKTTLGENEAGRSRRFGPLIVSPERSPSPIPVVKLPPQSPPKFRFRPTAPAFYPRRAEYTAVPALPHQLHPAVPNLYPGQAENMPYGLASLPPIPPHSGPAALSFYSSRAEHMPHGLVSLTPIPSRSHAVYPGRAEDIQYRLASLPPIPPHSRAEVPSFYPGRAEDMPYGLTSLPPIPPRSRVVYPGREEDMPYGLTSIPALPPHPLPGTIGAAPATPPTTPHSSLGQRFLIEQRPFARTYDESQPQLQDSRMYYESQYQHQHQPLHPRIYGKSQHQHRNQHQHRHQQQHQGLYSESQHQHQHQPQHPRIYGKSQHQHRNLHQYLHQPQHHGMYGENQFQHQHLLQPQHLGMYSHQHQHQYQHQAMYSTPDSSRSRPDKRASLYDTVTM